MSRPPVSIDILTLIKIGNLSDEQMAHLKNKLIERKRALQSATTRVNRAVKLLEKKARSKKRKSAKRAPKR
jgi:hypothetical protein